jgi:hypothetical protein
MAKKTISRYYPLKGIVLRDGYIFEGHKIKSVPVRTFMCAVGFKIVLNSLAYCCDIELLACLLASLKLFITVILKIRYLNFLRRIRMIIKIFCLFFVMDNVAELTVETYSLP